MAYTRFPIYFDGIVRKFPKNPVIYKILNRLDSKVYIGQAVNFRKRYNQHNRHLMQGKHHSYYLQNAVNKHGLYSFTFEIIEETTREQLSEREIYWINFYNSCDSNCGYNLTAEPQYFGSNTRTERTKQAISKALKGRILPDEVKAKISKTKKGVYLGNRHPKAKEVYQYTKNMDFINKYETINEAVRCTGIGRTSISNNINNYTKSSGGYVWRCELKVA